MLKDSEGSEEVPVASSRRVKYQPPVLSSVGSEGGVHVNVPVLVIFAVFVSFSYMKTEGGGGGTNDDCGRDGFG